MPIITCTKCGFFSGKARLPMSSDDMVRYGTEYQMTAQLEQRQWL